MVQADLLEDESSEDLDDARAADHESLSGGSGDELDNDAAYDAMIQAVQGVPLMPPCASWLMCPLSHVMGRKLVKDRKAALMEIFLHCSQCGPVLVYDRACIGQLPLLQGCFCFGV